MESNCSEFYHRPSIMTQYVHSHVSHVTICEEMTDKREVTFLTEFLNASWVKYLVLGA